TSMEYDERKIIDCIGAAGLAGRLAELPEGIRTNLYQLQEGGVEVSGGEAQKLAIARALYKDAPFVVLDEPTSALDPVAEYDIYKRFDDLVQDKTAVYISHRMSSCRFCNNIFVFEDGRIVQKGSHDSLMLDEEGLYSKLWNAQAQYYQ
ncbi:MAG: ABC transporter ATP-binding protein, partial [Lachnospiraceae bacterium]|nr:ABC transporter ATP-binding protein [Lachnospiraceae bacterium]